MNSPCIESLGDHRYRCRNLGLTFTVPEETREADILCPCTGQTPPLSPGRALQEMRHHYRNVPQSPELEKCFWFLENRCGRCLRLTYAGCREYGDCEDCWPKWRAVIQNYGITGTDCPKFSAVDPRRIDCCYVINLERRPDRYAQFLERLPADWPFPPPERFAAIDGQKTPPPAWFRGGKGAWGCLRSHLAVVERCLNAGHHSVLILEDDAVFCDGFAEKCRRVLERVPPDWEILYLGGQHLRQGEQRPQKIAEGVARPFNVNRTHAWTIRGGGLQKVYQHLQSKKWPRAHHIDHQLGVLLESGRINAYCADPWLVGQAAGKSNVSGRESRERFWQPPAAWKVPPKNGPLPRVIAVVGPFRSGTSAIAGTLHHLGVSMGWRFRRPNAANPKGFFEAIKLGALCRRSFREPGMEEQNTPGDRVELLKNWARGRRNGPAPIGAKHPTLCLMVSEMAEAWPELSIVSVDRDPAASIASAEKLRWWPPGTAERLIPSMIARRDEALEKIQTPILRVRYEHLIADPEEVLEDLIEFAKISPTEKQILAAQDFFDPSLNHHGT